MSALGEAYKAQAKAFERQNGKRKSATVAAREYQERRLERIRGEQARLRAEFYARQAS